MPDSKHSKKIYDPLSDSFITVADGETIQEAMRRAHAKWQAEHPDLCKLHQPGDEMDDLDPLDDLD